MSQFKGKYGELKVILYLLNKGYTVYTPIIDTGIDFVVEPPSSHKYIGLQVRTSSYQKENDWWTWSIYKDDWRKGSPFFYILAFGDIDKLPKEVRVKIDENIFAFIIPYEVLDKILTNRSERWVQKGDYTLFINRQSFETGRSEWLETLCPYLNKWSLLT
ncbi:MAG: hypothetical protein QW270_00605 [Candidatus Bathyarchaeia archaeon]